MSNINWKQKLTSRKFWTAVASFISLLIVAFGGAQPIAVQVTAIIMAGAAVVAYVLGEGLVDAAGVGNSSSSSMTGSDEVVDTVGRVIGTVPDTAAANTTATGSAVASQTQQVTAGLSNSK